MKEPYKGDTDRANRLHAARKAAGFKSSREAAVRFGWHPGTYKSHETAARYFDAETGRVYADALGVSRSWLMDGRGRGPSLDPVRTARFEIRKAAATKPAQGAAGRLRVARRLAGYRSVVDASRKIDVNRSTLSAHENGQNDLSREAAIHYGQVFGVDPEWLLSGRMPSGLPAAAEAALGTLVSLHDEPESRALPHFRGLQRAVAAPPLGAKSRPEASSKHVLRGDRVAEYTSLALYRKLSGVKQGSSASGEWSFPEDYLLEVLGCQPATAAVLTVPPKWDDTPADRLPLRPGTRLVLDTGSVNPLPKVYYAVVRSGGGLRIVRHSAESHELARLEPDEKLAGAVCGVLGGALPLR
ncbi:helix-turn-helix transcriptional regulator [Bradyrhizobium manausense]|uniref:helix-turn-helix domain-containing protein n=1 Tax=Bradyrhizobium manausense TaxID=989370 RepID=UPI001BAAE170|nr:helix-turn-helix transcriptional regulator [Bradyrhizobium manausense]MBR0684411.1 helix-turn-helix transcriptional regulator [Bradyrhizobium manausense]